MEDRRMTEFNNDNPIQGNTPDNGPVAPAGGPQEPDDLAAFQQLCQEKGIMPQHAQTFYEIVQKAVDAEQDAAFERGNQELAKLWGNKKDEYLDLANKVLKTFIGSPEELNAICEEYGNDPRLIKLLVNIGNNMRADMLARGAEASFDMSPTAARAKAHDILRNKDNPLNEAYFKKSHPRHQNAVDEVTRLNGIAARARR